MPSIPLPGMGQTELDKNNVSDKKTRYISDKNDVSDDIVLCHPAIALFTITTLLRMLKGQFAVKFVLDNLFFLQLDCMQQSGLIN